MLTVWCAIWRYRGVRRVEHLGDLIGETLRAGQGRALTVALNALHDRGDRGREPDDRPRLPKDGEIGVPLNHPAAAVEHETVPRGKGAHDFFLQVTETGPADVVDDLRNTLACPSFDLGIQVDDFQIQAPGQQCGHGGFARATISDEHDVHSLASTTLRITSRGAG